MTGKYKAGNAVALLICASCILSVRAQLASNSSDNTASVILSSRLTVSKGTELRYELDLTNDGSHNIYYSANPQQADGTLGPYVSFKKDDSSLIVQSCVFDRRITNSINIYSNKTGVELKKLEQGKTAVETVVLKWPLSETVPPNLRKNYRKIDRSDLTRIRFIVCYVEEDEGVLELLKRKPFGWFIKGDEEFEAGINRRKRFSEVLKSASFEVVVPGETSADSK